MSIEIAKLGWADPQKVMSAPGSVVLPTSVGTTIVVIPEFNDAGSFAQNNAYGNGSDNRRILVFEINAAFTTATQKAAVVASGGLQITTYTIAADLFSDNSVGIVYQDNSGIIKYNKVTYGTWAISSATTVLNAPAVNRLAISINTTDIVAIALLRQNNSNPKITFSIHVLSGGSFVNSVQQTLMNGGESLYAAASIDICWSSGGSASARPLIVATSSAQIGGNDHGARVYTAVVNESTGAVANITLAKTYLAGNMDTGGWGYPMRKVFVFASSGTAPEFTLAVAENYDKRTMLVARFTWTGGAFTEVVAPVTSAAKQSIEPEGRMAASYCNDTVNFYYAAPSAGVLSIINYVARIDRTFATAVFSGDYKWDNDETNGTDRLGVAAGTGRNAWRATRHSMIFFAKNANKLYAARFHSSEPAPAPFEVTPASGQVLLTSTPELSAKIRVGKRFGQSRYKMIWQFALDAGFTSSVKTYIQPDTKWISVDGTQQAIAFAYFTDVLPNALALSSGSWFVRAAAIDEFNIQTPWSAVGSSGGFSHPPAAANLSPGAGVSIADGTISFAWKFTDPLESDVQTAYQIVVENTVTGAVIYDSGKIDSASAIHQAALPAGNTGVILQWKIRLWDSDVIPGPYSAYETFIIASPPTVVINSPTDNGTVASGTPNIAFTVGCATTRTIKAYQVTVVQGGLPVASSGIVATAATNGTQLSWRPENVVLDNGAYQVQVTVTDNSGMQAVSTVTTFTVAQVAAPSATNVTVSSLNYNNEQQGYVALSWSDSARDTNFQSWIIERKVDEIDYVGVIVESGLWKPIGTITTASLSGYTYRDYYAPSGPSVSYRVRQMVNRNGDRAISTNDTVVVTVPKSEGYWLVAPTGLDSNPLVVKISNVVSDSYTSEYESNTYNIPGRGRHVDKGERLGVSGSLQAQLRDTVASSARFKKRRLEALSIDNPEAGYIRTPFGDVWPVDISSMTINRIAGVGLSEACDIDLPYTEVGT